MSAIWGKIIGECKSKDSIIKEREVSLLRKPYEEKCKIDRMETITKETFTFSCGIQYITTESFEEKMPYEDENCVFTADCLIDNREELLSGLDLEATAPDGKLFYYAYQKWGTECFSKVEGLYAVAVYDKESKQLILAVDKMAHRSLYYYLKEEEVYFSTLIEPIMLSEPGIQMNRNFVKDYLTAPGMLPNLSDFETPYEGIFQVKAGTFLSIDVSPKENGLDERVSENRYWEPSRSRKKYSYNNADICGKEFRQVLEGALKRATRTCGEVGVALSSGFDSATISSVAADQLLEKGKKLYTFTYVPAPEFDDVQKKKNLVLNEKEDVLKIVSMHPAMEPEFLYREGKHCFENIEEMQRVMEVPYKAYVNIPHLNEIYAKAYQKGCRIVMIGQCGNSTISFGLIDDVLYELYKQKRFVTLLKWLNHYSKTIKESRKQAFKMCLSMYRETSKEYRKDDFHYKLSNPWIHEKILEDYPIEERYRASKKTKFMNLPTDQLHYRENLYSISMYAYIGAMETKLGLHQGIVLRDPTRDPEIVSFCYHMPFLYFAYNGVTRWLIREVCKDMLPKEITCNYLRYGVQNKDWLDRIFQNRAEILSDMKKNIGESSFSDCYNMETVFNFLTEMAENDEWNEFDFLDIFYLYMEGQFEQYVKNCEKYKLT